MNLVQTWNLIGLRLNVDCFNPDRWSIDMRKALC